MYSPCTYSINAQKFKSALLSNNHINMIFGEIIRGTNHKF